MKSLSMKCSNTEMSKTFKNHKQIFFRNAWMFKMYQRLLHLRDFDKNIIIFKML